MHLKPVKGRRKYDCKASVRRKYVEKPAVRRMSGILVNDWVGF